MMNIQKLVIVPAVIVLLAAGCAGGPLSKAGDVFAGGGDGLLVVSNETAADLVLFAGTVERGTMLGGIGAMSSRSFDIAKITDIPETGAFMLRGVLAETYRQKAASLSGADVLYSGLVVYDLKSERKVEKAVSGEMDETMLFSITVINDSPAVCELRLDAPDGPAAAALSPFEQLRRVWIKPLEDAHPRFLWPVYVFSGEDGAIETFTDHVQQRIPQSEGEAAYPLHLHGAVDDVVMPLLFE